MPDGRAVALKIADGGERARLPVMLAALRSLGFDVVGGDATADPRPRSSGRRGQRPRRRVNGVGSVLVAEAGELRRAAFEVGLHALGEVGPPEALHHQPHRRRRAAAPSPACSWAYTWRFMIAIDVGDDRSARSHDVLAGGGQQLVGRAGRG